MVATAIDLMGAFQCWDNWLKCLVPIVGIGVNALTAMVLCMVFYIAVRILLRVVRARLSSTSWNAKKDAANTVVVGLNFLLWMQLVPVLLGQLGIAIEPIIGSLTLVALSVAIPVALTAEHSNPFPVGDVVRLAGGGVTGVILKMSAAFTEVRTLDGCHVFLPNASICPQMIRNHTQEDRCKVDVRLPLPPHTSARGLLEARRVMLAAVGREEMVLPYPEPVMVVQSSVDVPVAIMARVWVLPGDRSTAEPTLREVVREAFSLNGITMTAALPAPRDGDLPPIDDPAE